MRGNAPNTQHPATTLTPRQRLTRGLAYSAAGPVDVTRGVVGLGVHSARTGAANLRRRYRETRLAREVAAAPETIATELAAAQGVVTGLPQVLHRPRWPHRRGRRPWMIGGVVVVLLIGGAAAVVVTRRCVASRPPGERSPRPPSVDVQPRP